MRYFIYQLADDPTKGLYIFQDEAGWFYIARLPRSRDNIFSSIEEIELVVNKKLVFKEEYFPQ